MNKADFVKISKFTFVFVLLYTLWSYTLFSAEYKKYLHQGKKYLDEYFHKQREALKMLKKAYELNKEDEEVLYWLGKAYYENRYYEEAKLILEELVEKNPNVADYHAYLAYTYGRLGGENIIQRAYYKMKALGRINTVLKLNPNYADAYYALACGYTYLKMYSFAKKNLDKAIELNPNNPWYRVGLGWLYLRQDKIKEADKAFEIARKLAEKEVRLDTKNDHVLRIIALYYEEKMLWDKALYYAKLALKWNPKDLCLDEKYSLKNLIKRLEKEKKLNKLLAPDISEEAF